MQLPLLGWVQLLMRHKPTIVGLQEDSTDMLRTLFAHREVFHSPYQVSLQC
jgi:hypothetical protein